MTPAVSRLFSFLLVACFDSSFSRWAQPYHGAGAAHHDTYNSALPVLAATPWALVPVFTAMSCSANKSEIQLSRIGVGLKCAPGERCSTFVPQRRLVLSPRIEQLVCDTASVARAPVSLHLHFGEEVCAAVRPRILYAVRVFAAIYGYQVAEAHQSTDVRIFYSEKPPAIAYSQGVWVPARYHAELPPPCDLELTRREYAGENFALFFGVDRNTKNPDWLGEIFEWLSCSHERRITQRDAIGRIPYAHSVFAQQHISPRKPHASLLMAWLQNEIVNPGGTESLPKPASPAPDAWHLVVCSHDVDFYFTSKSSALVRLLKNLVIACQAYHSWSFFTWNALQLFRVVAGKRVGEYLGPLCRASQEYDFRSTIFAVSNRRHRRDPNYDLAELAPDLKSCAENGFSIGLHGSYESVTEKSSLLQELAAMRKSLGTKPLGTRQHWLRLGGHQSFFDTIESAGLVYDSTLGFAEVAGFRNGACFAFPPYDFKREQPYPFLEIPLVLMDGNVEAAARLSGENADAIAEEILAESRRWGWGGIAADWHNPTEPIQVPDEINQIFWRQVRNQKSNGERWVSAEEFIACCLRRYQGAGLLRDVRLDA